MSRLLARHAPYHIGKVIGHNERTFWIDRYANRATAAFAVVVAKSGDEVNRRSRRTTVIKRDEDDFVAHGIFAVPAAVLTDKNEIGKFRSHARLRKIYPKCRHVRP